MLDRGPKTPPSGRKTLDPSSRGAPSRRKEGDQAPPERTGETFGRAWAGPPLSGTRQHLGAREGPGERVPLIRASGARCGVFDRAGFIALRAMALAVWSQFRSIGLI